MHGNSEVIVVGGGVVGSAAAYQLAKSHVNVTLVDVDLLGQATAAGAGIISPGTSYLPPAPYYPLSYKAASYYPQLLAELKDVGAEDAGYQVVGSLYLATTEEEEKRLLVLERLLRDRLQAGVPNISEVSRISNGQAKELFPAIADIDTALYIAGSARLNGRLLRDALHKAAVKYGAKMISGEASIICEGGVVKGIHVNGNVITADAVVVTSGSWSNRFKQATGIEIPIEPQKGQILHIEMQQNTDNWPILLGFSSHYMLTFPQNRLVFGATREDNSGYDTRVTVGGMQELVGQALRMAPGLANSTVLEVRVGLRPASPDHLPILGEVPGIDGLYLATGHGANGLTAGAYSGILVANQVLGQSLDVDLSPFSLTRFQ